MDKEKLFNDMKAIIMENEYDYEDGDAGDIANALIDAGYRNADEVRKEMLEFLETLKVDEDGRHAWRDNHNDAIDRCRKKIIEHFNIEVDK